MNNITFPASAMPDADWWRTLWFNPDAVIRDIGITPTMSVLDLACGDGYFTAAIARQIRPMHVTGFDLDATMLASAQTYCNELTNCDWVLGDAMALSQLITQKMDYVLIANTFHGVPNQRELCRQIAQILTPTGKLAIINWHDLPREKINELKTFTYTFALPALKSKNEKMKVYVWNANKTSFLMDDFELKFYHYKRNTRATTLSRATSTGLHVSSFFNIQSSIFNNQFPIFDAEI